MTALEADRPLPKAPLETFESTSERKRMDVSRLT